MTIVIKLGGRVQAAGDLAVRIMAAWNDSAGSLCIVHGGGDEVSALQRQLGREPTFLNGRRITTADDLDLVRMVLSGSANKRLVASLVAEGLPAAGISGEDAGMLIAEPIDEGSLGRAGKPTIFRPELIRALLNAGYLPVISPVGVDGTSAAGAPLNVNGDDAAAAIAAALAAELWLIADVPGVMGESGEALSSLSAGQMEEMIAAGVVTQGMQAKLEAGFSALATGATGVRIGGLDAVTDRSTGTTLSLTPSMR